MKKNKPKPDDRRDNVEKIQRNISNTIHNMEIAEEMAGRTPDKKMSNELKDKNERRRDALDGMRREIRDEATDREKDYKK